MVRWMRLVLVLACFRPETLPETPGGGVAVRPSAPQAPVVTPVTGPSWLKRLGLIRRKT